MAKTRDVAASFEAALGELEEIVAKMEGGQLPLRNRSPPTSVARSCSQYCQAALKDAQLQIEVLEKGVLEGLCGGRQRERRQR